MSKEMKPIPVSAAEVIASLYGYDQVVILARRIREPDEPNGEHVTTFGVSPEHSFAAATISDRLKYEILSWKKEEITDCGNDLGEKP